MKKTLKTVFLVILTLFILSLLFTFYRMWGVKTGRLFRLPNGTYLNYEEFHKIYPLENNADIPDKNRPEDVYTKFREAIVVGNIDEALKYIVERKREEYKVNLVKNLEEYKTLPEFSGLKKSNDYSGFQMGFDYEKNGQTYSVMLDKNSDGFWFIYGI